MLLRSGFILIAQRLQEAADAPAHSNVRAALAKAVSDAHPTKYAYYQDHTGDGETGDCIYGCDGDMHSAPYEMSTVGGKMAANLDTANAKTVMPVTSYTELADDDDHYTAMEAERKAAKIYTELPVYERFISKKERDNADEGSFAGKGKSFPILKPGDVSAAVHAMGRAGSDNYGPAQLKANIIRIAKAKGWTSELPKAWQGGDDKATEAARAAAAAGSIKLTESFAWADEILLSESVASGVEREIRIIVPCKGSSAVYTEAALKKSVQAFKPGTQMFINHATPAEEAQRPEGDWRKLVGQLTSAAQWNESHKSGAGLYAKAKFASSMAPEILEKASMSGVSIRANGRAATEAGRTLMKDGLPVLDEITSVESIDIVTKAGAGGVILTESARRANQGDDMSEDEKKRLLEAARIVETQNAREVGRAALSDLSLLEAGKYRAIDNVIGRGLPMTNGLLDTAKFVEAVKAEAKREGEYLAALLGGGRVVGMGGAPSVAVHESKKERKAREAALKEADASRAEIFSDIMGNSFAGTHAARGRAA
jgi:hypothetical protein